MTTMPMPLAPIVRPAYFWPLIKVVGTILAVEGGGQTTGSDHQVAVALITATSAVLVVVASRITFGRRRDRGTKTDAPTVEVPREEYLELLEARARLRVIEGEPPATRRRRP